jgi:hypothetical protein
VNFVHFLWSKFLIFVRGFHTHFAWCLGCTVPGSEPFFSFVAAAWVWSSIFIIFWSVPSLHPIWFFSHSISSSHSRSGPRIRSSTVDFIAPHLRPFSYWCFILAAASFAALGLCFGFVSSRGPHHRCRVLFVRLRSWRPAPFFRLRFCCHRQGLIFLELCSSRS